MADPTTDDTHTIHANELFEYLTQGHTELPAIDLDDGSFDSPYNGDSDLFNERPQLTIEDLTSSQVDGDGYFDKIMTSVKNHLKEEFQAGRIMGAEYTKAYIALTESSLNTATQFLLGKDQAYWQSVNAQLAAINLNVQIAKTKAELVGVESQTALAKANYALTKLGIDKANTELEDIMPAQKDLLEAQAAKEWANTVDEYQFPDGTEKKAVGGVIGKQKALYGQQLSSYKQNTINETLQPIFSTWSVGVTNAIPRMSLPSLVNKEGFHELINGMLTSLSTNAGWDDTIKAGKGTDENGDTVT